jgi:hypothetical protein
MKKIVITVFILAGFMTGCNTIPKDDIEIETERDPKANFSGYKTYAWLGAVGIVNDPQGYWEPPQFDADAEIVFLVNKALRKRGMSEVNDNPDMLMAYALGLDMAALKIKQNPETKLSTLENVPQTALVVTLIDPETEFVTWAAVATAEFKDLEPEAAKKRLNYAVKTMFKKLPKK